MSAAFIFYSFVSLQIGFNYGDGINGYMMNVSGTIDVLFVDETSNIGIPGRWVFKVDGKEIDVPSEDVQVSK